MTRRLSFLADNIELAPGKADLSISQIGAIRFAHSLPPLLTTALTPYVMDIYGRVAILSLHTDSIEKLFLAMRLLRCRRRLLSSIICWPGHLS